MGAMENIVDWSRGTPALPLQPLSLLLISLQKLIVNASSRNSFVA